MGIKTREVYIGNGQTIQVLPNNDIRYYLDIDKLEQVIKENPDKKICIGASGDWYWTAHKIKDIEKIKNGEEYILKSSDWSKFQAEIDDDEIVDLTIEIPVNISKLVYWGGFIDGIFKVERWLNGIYSKGIKKMKYEMIKDMQKELEPIIKKYIEKVETLEK